ncbi:MAG: hypothetical protein JO337_09685 [Acidimicrobiales bacterium]|nr:hypothetical protein [Acidimicrobiales bacterium]
MAARHVIVDGSNLATEGRSMPSLVQLDQAVREFLAENPTDVVTVVVDASFSHRIDPAEIPTFEEAEAAGEVVSPPAGAIGRGDAFLLRIAEKIGATVLSNDSFQEFHGEHTWLFDKGRLVGGKPVPGVGWIFMDRTPVRGHKSREVVKEAKRRKRGDSEPATVAAKAEAKASDVRASAPKVKVRPKEVDRAIARATQEVVEPKASAKSRRRRSGQPPADPVNEPLAFITFIAAHPLGSQVVGTAVEYTSHGVFVDADGARCYIPLSAMGEPPPRRAREVVTKGETRPFTVQAFDPPRRGIELALPEFARVAGEPTAETVEAEIQLETPKPTRAKKRSAAVRDEVPVEPVEAVPPTEAKPAKKAAAPAVKAPAKKAAAKKAAAPAVKAPAKKAAPVKKTATVKKTAPAKKVPTKKVPVKKATAAIPAPAKKAPAKKAPAKRAAAENMPAKKAPAKKAPAKKAPPAGPAE